MSIFPVVNSTALQSYARQLTKALIALARSPLVTGLLERWRGDSRGPSSNPPLDEDERELLLLVVYWFWEYVEHRISPRELLDVLSHLLTRFEKEV